MERAGAIDNISSIRYRSRMENSCGFKSVFSALSPEEKKHLATKADTSVAYLSQIANGHRKAGVELIVNLCHADIRMTPEMLRPDLYGESPMNVKAVA